MATLGLPLPGLPPLSDIPLPFLATLEAPDSPLGTPSQPAWCTHSSAVVMWRGVRSPQRESQTNMHHVPVIPLVQGSRPLQCLPALGHCPEPSKGCPHNCVCNCYQQEGHGSLPQKLKVRRQTFKDNFNAK